MIYLTRKKHEFGDRKESIKYIQNRCEKSNDAYACYTLFEMYKRDDKDKEADEMFKKLAYKYNYSDADIFQLGQHTLNLWLDKKANAKHVQQLKEDNRVLQGKIDSSEDMNAGLIITGYKDRKMAKNYSFATSIGKIIMTTSRPLWIVKD